MSFIHDIADIVAKSGDGLLSVHPSWERVRAGDVLTILNGFPFKSEHFNKSHGHPLLRIRDILHGETETYYDGPEIEGYWVERGDLVVGMDGDFNCGLWPGRRAFLNQRACKLMPDSSFYSRAFLAYALPGYLQAINRHTSSLTVKHLSSRTIADLPLPLPPRKEQDRIVAKLDELFSRVEKGEENLKRVQALVKRYRQAVLKAAVTGELTRDWREKNAGKGESGAELLQRILAARRTAWEKAELAKMKAKGKIPADDRWKRRYEEPEVLDTDGLPGLPDGWVWAALPQLGEFGRGKSKHRPRNDPRLLGGSYPFLQTGDIRRSNGRIRSYEATYNEEGLRQSKLWPKGTVCITIAANIAESGVLEFEACFPDSVVGLVSVDGILAEYVEAFVRTAQSDLTRYAPATAQKNINLETLNQLAIPLPPSPEQQAIVEELESRLSVLANLAEVLRQACTMAESARQSILASAFCGKLAPQDSNDEPASVLLKRIAAERDNGGAPKLKRGRPKKAESRLTQEALS
ncbi:MAG: restriction endonuclease subunit S [Dongiaceae bacterium]